MIAKKNFDWVDGISNRKPPAVDYFAHDAYWLAMDREIESIDKPTWRDRLARMLLEKIILILTRDAEQRRRLCLAIAPELRRTNEWLDKDASPPPPPKE